MKTKIYDVVVIGLGAMGSAITYQLAQKGATVLGIDQYDIPHAHGSSHGDTRITRTAIGEGIHYTPFALRSQELWKHLEQKTGKKLLTTNGGLIISSKSKVAINHTEHVFEKTVTAARTFSIKHEILSATEIRNRFPQFRIKDDEYGYFEPAAGYVNPETCIQAQLTLAKKYGADLNTNEKFISFEDLESEVVVTTNKGTYRAKDLVIAAGPWLPELLDKKYSRYFRVMRQVLYWFDVSEHYEQFVSEKFPVFVHELQGDHQAIYGFPAVNGARGGIKVATEQYVDETAPKSIRKEVDDEEITDIYQRLVANTLQNVSSACIKKTTCMYTVTPDHNFVIDRHPEHANVLLVSPCSGHGFKHSAAIGEAVAELLVKGTSCLDIKPFSISRFGKFSGKIEI